LKQIAKENKLPKSQELDFIKGSGLCTFKAASKALVSLYLK